MNNSVETDALLIRRALAGEADAVGRLTERCRPMVFALCLQWTRNPTDADDLTQETLLRASSRLDQVREPERFKAWLGQIAVNVCKNWQTRERHDLLPIIAAEQASHAQDVTQGIVLREAMTALSPDLRQVIEWFYLEGFSQKEIALLWRLPQSTVKGRLDAGRLRLRKEFEEMGLLPAEMFEEAVPASRIALTDADPEETKALRAALKAAGFACSVLKPEDLILSRLRRLRPDILVLNTPFGALDEYDILQALRIDQRLRGTCVLFLSARSDNASVFKAWNSGVDCYLTKPFDAAEAAHFVQRLDAHRRALDYIGLGIEYAWRRQTESTLRCLSEAIRMNSQAAASPIRTEAAFNYLRQTPEFAALLAKLPPEAESGQAQPGTHRALEVAAASTGDADESAPAIQSPGSG